MNLFEEEQKSFKPKEKKPINITLLLGIFIAIFLVLAIIIVITIVYLRNSVLTITINGNKVDDSIMEAITLNDDGTSQISIKKLASFLDYKIYSGDYETLSEDSNKAYIQYGNQIISYEKNSNIIIQITVGESTTSKEKLVLSENITDISGDMYLNSEDVAKMLCIDFSYKKNKIQINTLDYVYELYEDYYVEKNKYVKIEDVTTENKKAILDNMLISKDLDENYGVINAVTGEIILEFKYDNIEYLRENKEFLITRSNKKSIISIDKTVKLENYDDITIINLNDNKYYLLSSNKLFGLANYEGKTIIYPEYNQIGIDGLQFPNNDLESNYLIADTYIPLLKDKMYSLYNINTQSFLEEQYTSLGYTSKTSNIYSTIQIPEFGLTVVQKDDKYDFITQEGANLFGFILDGVYFTVSNGKKTYYMEYNNNAIDILSYLDEKGMKRVK